MGILGLPLNILLVEDNPGDALLVREMLSGGGLYKIHTSISLATAIDNLFQKDIDLILLDLGLPDSLGFSTLTRMLEVASQVPIVVLTGHQDEDLGIRAVQEGAQDYLVKGEVNDLLLKRTIRYSIERKQAAERLRERTAELTETRDTLQTIMQTAPLAIIGLNIAGSVISWNTKAENLLGWTADEALDKAPPYICGKLQQEFQIFLHTVISGGTIYGKEVTLCTKNGVEITLRAFAAPQHSTEGTILGATILYEDITDQHRMELAIEASESLWNGYSKIRNNNLPSDSVRIDCSSND